MEITPPNAPISTAREERMMDAAKAMEANFLAEMLKSTGLGKTPEAFGGGSGEDQFSSFLRDEHARQLTEAGGIGLAQSLFDAMMRSANAQSRD